MEKSSPARTADLAQRCGSDSDVHCVRSLADPSSTLGCNGRAQRIYRLSESELDGGREAPSCVLCIPGSTACVGFEGRSPIADGRRMVPFGGLLQNVLVHVGGASSWVGAKSRLRSKSLDERYGLVSETDFRVARDPGGISPHATANLA